MRVRKPYSEQQVGSVASRSNGPSAESQGNREKKKIQPPRSPRSLRKITKKGNDGGPPEAEFAALSGQTHCGAGFPISLGLCAEFLVILVILVFESSSLHRVGQSLGLT
jgi:hypothetical protein